MRPAAMAIIEPFEEVIDTTPSERQSLNDFTVKRLIG
jgi:hypothetical protein